MTPGIFGTEPRLPGNGIRRLAVGLPPSEALSRGGFEDGR